VFEFCLFEFYLDMYGYDISRFSPLLTDNSKWIKGLTQDIIYMFILSLNLKCLFVKKEAMNPMLKTIVLFSREMNL